MNQREPTISSKNARPISAISYAILSPQNTSLSSYQSNNSQSITPFIELIDHIVKS